MLPIRSTLARVAFLAAMALLTNQVTGAALYHSHSPAPDVHERAWCDGEHAPKTPPVDHGTQRCQVCRHRADNAPRPLIESIPSLAPAPRQASHPDGSAEPLGGGVWSDGIAPTRGPPTGS